MSVVKTSPRGFLQALVPLLARDLATLVPEDHPSRHAHAVVLNG